METINGLPDDLREKYRTWRETVFCAQKGLFEDLVTHGQHPETMVISCCDSRIDITAIFGANPGDLFIHRNIASLVPPYRDRRRFPGTVAAVEYAVTALGVKNIVVMGHSQCGGVKGCYDICTDQADALDPKTSSVGQWVDMLRPDFMTLLSQSPEDVLATLEHESVRFSVTNLLAYPFVADRVSTDDLRIHGFWHDLKTGDIITLNHNNHDFEPL